MITVTVFGDSYENNAISEATTIPYIKESKESKIKSSINKKNRYPKLKAGNFTNFTFHSIYFDKANF